MTFEASQILSVKMNPELPHIFMVKNSFEIVNIHILCIELCEVCMLTGTGHMLGWDNALQHGSVFNHPLVQT